MDDADMSLGLEVECWLPDLSKLVPDRLCFVRDDTDLFRLVADSLSETIAGLAERSESAGELRCKARVVSAEEMDWGRSWTASADQSIVPTPVALSKCDASPFPVELVSQIMRFAEADVRTFCDVCAALRSEPYRARTNSSTGLHVHVGRHFAVDERHAFFSLEELETVVCAYLRFESVINRRLLPLLRQRNSYCRDLKDAIAEVAGLPRRDDAASADAQSALANACIDFVRRAVHFIRAVDYNAIFKPCRVDKAKLSKHLVGDEDGRFARIGNGPSRGFGMPVVEPANMLVPAGMVLVRLAERDQLLWAATTDSNKATFSSIWDALDFDGSENTALACVFQAAQGVEDETSFRRFLFRDALLPSGRQGAQGLLSGAVSSMTSPNKYYKLNLGRLALPARKATIEFRQFAGQELEHTLVIWGWARFVGAFVARACEGFNDALYRGQGTTTEQDLLDFMRLSNDTMMIAWWRDAANSVDEPRVQVTTVKSSFAALFDDWLNKSRIAAALEHDTAKRAERRKRLRRHHVDDQEDLWWSDDDDQLDVEDDPHVAALVEACDAWRRVFHAASALRYVVPATDVQVWGRFAANKHVAENFVAGVADALERCLVAYCRKLRAAEESSRSASLVTTAELCCGAALKKGHLVLRAIKAAVTETRGEQALPVELRLRVSNLADLATKLTLDHAANLLSLCESAARRLSKTNTIRSRRSTEIVDRHARELAASDHERELKWGLARGFKNLCTSLLAPRVRESAVLWTGLEQRGWLEPRVSRLNDDVASILKYQRKQHFLPQSSSLQRLPNAAATATADPRARQCANQDHAASLNSASQVGPRADFETLFVRQSSDLPTVPVAPLSQHSPAALDAGGEEPVVVLDPN